MEVCSFWEYILMFKICLTLHIIIESLPLGPRIHRKPCLVPKSLLCCFSRAAFSSPSLFSLSNLATFKNFLVPSPRLSFLLPVSRTTNAAMLLEPFLQWEWMPLFHYENWLLDEGFSDSEKWELAWIGCCHVSRVSLDFDSGRIFNEKNASPRSLSPFSMPNPLLQVEKETESRFLD